MRIDMRRLAFDGLQASDTHTLGIYCSIASSDMLVVVVVVVVRST